MSGGGGGEEEEGSVSKLETEMLDADIDFLLLQKDPFQNLSCPLFYIRGKPRGRETTPAEREASRGTRRG